MVSLTACGPEDVDIAKAIQRNLPNMPSFCEPLPDEEIRAVLTSLKGQPPEVVTAALGNRWLNSNSEKGACVKWYKRQQKRYGGK